MLYWYNQIVPGLWWFTLRASFYFMKVCKWFLFSGNTLWILISCQLQWCYKVLPLGGSSEPPLPGSLAATREAESYWVLHCWAMTFARLCVWIHFKLTTFWTTTKLAGHNSFINQGASGLICCGINPGLWEWKHFVTPSFSKSLCKLANQFKGCKWTLSKSTKNLFVFLRVDVYVHEIWRGEVSGVSRHKRLFALSPSDLERREQCGRLNPTQVTSPQNIHWPACPWAPTVPSSQGFSGAVPGPVGGRYSGLLQARADAFAASSAPLLSPGLHLTALWFSLGSSQTLLFPRGFSGLLPHSIPVTVTVLQYHLSLSEIISCTYQSPTHLLPIYSAISMCVPRKQGCVCAFVSTTCHTEDLQ